MDMAFPAHSVGRGSPKESIFVIIIDATGASLGATGGVELSMIASISLLMLAISSLKSTSIHFVSSGSARFRAILSAVSLVETASLLPQGALVDRAGSLSTA